MHVQQLSIAYTPEQDRILVRVNTSEKRELQCWFTRRLTLGLLPLLDKVVTEHIAGQGSPASAHLAAPDALSKKAVAEFQRSESLRTADFSTPYKVPESSEPLFESPPLVTDVHIAPVKGGPLRLSCSEKLAGSGTTRRFELALSGTLVHAFVHLLERAVAQSQWRELPPATAAPSAAPAPARPGYLN